MSAIVGLIRGDQAPLDRSLLQRLTASMSLRAPDAIATWADGPVGFGHALLRNRVEPENQPLSLGGELWITADARLDGRSDLIAALRSAGAVDSKELEAAPDARLILHAYRAWGATCLEHLIGDFAFAIWDRPRQQLFCARDHFGVKPFHYAQVEGGLLFGNALACLLHHPAVSRRIDDRAIADFLLFGLNQDLGSTVYADIRRLPPAHCLTWSGGKLELRRYWSLPLDGAIRYRSPDQYLERFRELLQSAVADRLGCGSAGVLMSGGMDSTSVAATALEVAPELDLQAYTLVFDRLIPDRERHYSNLVAENLGIPIHHLVSDDYRLYERWDHPEFWRPEPHYEPLKAHQVDMLHQAAARHRVLLTGFGGDPVLMHSRSYLPGLLRRLRFGRLAADLRACVQAGGRIPRLGLRSQLQRWIHGVPSWPYPTWLNSSFASRLNLARRWQERNRMALPAHPRRAEACKGLLGAMWPALFESYDPSFTGLPLEVRHPFFDVRLITYLLALPPLPWFDQKHILREAMRGRLPEAVRRRPKTALVGDPIFTLLRREPRLQCLEHGQRAPELLRYVDPAALAVPSEVRADDRPRSLLNLRVISLNYWLKQIPAAQFG